MLDPLRKVWDGTGEIRRDAAGWLGDYFGRAKLQGPDGRLGTGLGGRADHDDRHGRLPHDLLKRGEPVHPRHLDVEREHVRPKLGDTLDSLDAVASLAHHDDVGIGSEMPVDEPAHEDGIVRHYDADWVGRHAVDVRGRGSGEHAVDGG